MTGLKALWKPTQDQRDLETSLTQLTLLPETQEKNSIFALKYYFKNNYNITALEQQVPFSHTITVFVLNYFDKISNAQVNICRTLVWRQKVK